MSAEVVAAVRAAVHHRVIVVNNTYELAPWADLLYAADGKWWEVNHKATLKFYGLKVTCTPVPFDDVLQLRDTGRDGFDPDPSCVRTGGNSGYQAVHVAAHLGAARILLCGFDMHGGHWHERHKDPLREHGEGIYARWIQRFETLAPPLKERGVEVINCTPGSALHVWPHETLESALQLERIAA